jgi:hypothetical protein
VVTTVLEVGLVALAMALLSRRHAAALRRSSVLWAVPVLIAPTAALAVLSAVGAIGFLPASG